MSRPRKPARRDPSSPQSSPLAALDGVKPVRGARRVALVQGRHSGPVSAPRSTAPQRFVIEWDADRVAAYDESCGPGALKEVLDPRFVPQVTVDLHRRRVAGLSDELAERLRLEVRRGVRRLLVVHGRGRHSVGGTGVLREAVLEAFTEGAAAHYVRAFATAPRRLGGSGALVVSLLRRTKK